MAELNGIALLTAEPVEPEVLRPLAAFLARRLGRDVSTGEITLPVSEYLDRERGQVDSARLMRSLAEVAPPDFERVLALLQHDLHLPMLTFLFGHAQLDGRLALVSLARLRQEFYGLAPAPPLLERRLRKECLHELGHTYGLRHCESPVCCMSLSSTIEQVDAKGDEFCPGCRAWMREHRAITCEDPAPGAMVLSPEVST